MAMQPMHGTTILAVRRGDRLVMIGDGQVSFGETIVKHSARKVRRITEQVLGGFAGSTADALTLFEKFEAKLKDFNQNLTRACVELAKDWRTDRVLRRLEALLLVASAESTYLVSGGGDVIEPDGGVIGIGSGGVIAQAAAEALMARTDLDVRAIAEESMRIAARLCIYTNDCFVVEELGTHG